MVSYLEESWGMSIKGASMAAGGLAWALGIGSVLSYTLWSTFYPLGFMETFETSTVMGIIDFITANYMMLGGGILIAVFVGWSFKDDWIKEEFKNESPILFTIWLWLARVVAPASVAIALFFQLTA